MNLSSVESVLAIGSIPVYLAFTVLLGRSIPIDIDSANHLRLAQIWHNGIYPTHAYTIGVKWVLPRIYFLVFPLINWHWRRHRWLNVVQSSLTHVSLGLILDFSDEETLIAHGLLFFLNISPMVFPFTSALDQLVVSSTWTLALWASSARSQVAAVLIIATYLVTVLLLSIVWKLSELTYLLVGVPLFINLSPQYQVIFAACFALVSYVFLVILTRQSRRIAINSSAKRLISYRKTRTLSRRKVWWPAALFTLFVIILLPAIDFSETLKSNSLIVVLWICAVIRNIISGDFATGPGAYHLYFPLVVLFAFSESSARLYFFIFLAILATLPHLSKPNHVGNLFRRISQGEKYPSDPERIRMIAGWLSEQPVDSRRTVLLGTDTVLALHLNLHAISGFPYTVVHWRDWSLGRADTSQLLAKDYAILVSEPTSEDFQDLLTKLGKTHARTDFHGVSLFIPRPSAQKSSANLS